MNLIKGKIVARETGGGMPNLVVEAYDVYDHGAVRAIESSGKAPVPKLPVVAKRLGSASTDTDGRFVLSYEVEDSPKGQTVRRPNLALRVLAVDDPGLGDGPAVLYTSSEVRVGAGAVESYVIQLPMTSVPGPKAARKQYVARRLPDFNALLDALQQVADGGGAGAQPGPDPSFSKRYQARLDRVNSLKQKINLVERPPLSFPLTPRLYDADGKDFPDGTTFRFDPEEGQFVLQQGPQDPAVAVDFVGVVYGSAQAADGLGIVVDQGQAEFRIALPRSSSPLYLPEPVPSALYQWYQGRVRAAQAARVAAPRIAAPKGQGGPHG